MDPNVNDMKYNELRSYAKELGIVNFSSIKPKKEEILEAIKNHIEQKQQKEIEQDKPSKRKITKTKKLIESEEVTIKTPAKSTKAKKIKQTNEINEKHIEENNQEEAKTPKKIKKVKKIKIKDNIEPNEELDKIVNEEEITKKVKKVKKVKEKMASLELKEQTIEEPIAVVKKTPGRPRKKQIIQEAPVQDFQNENKQEVSNKTLDDTSRVKKNTKKKYDSNQKTIESEGVVPETEIKKKSTKKVKKVVKKKKSKSSDIPSEQDDNLSSPINQIENVEQNNVQDDFQLRLEKDDDEFSNHAAQQQVITTTTTTTTLILADSSINQNSRKSNTRFNDHESIMTNDDSFQQSAPKTPQTSSLTRSNRKSLNKASKVLNDILIQEEQKYQSPVRSTRRSIQPEIIVHPPIVNTNTFQVAQDPNITNDIQNTTFDKSIHDEIEAPNSQALPCTTFYKSNNATQSEPQETLTDNPEVSDKPKPKGARIVRPTQTVTCIVPAISETNINKEEEVVTKKVEIVRREAGPRIVKPTILTENETAESNNTLKRKVNPSDDKIKKQKNENQISNKEKSKKKTLDSNNNNSEPKSAKKISVKMPNFKAIHEKAESKLENIHDYVNRKTERMRKITGQETLTLKSPTAKTTITSKTTVSSTNLSTVNKAKTPMSTSKLNPVSRLFNYNKNKTPLKSEQITSSITPKINKCQSASSVSSNIPRLNFNNKKPSTSTVSTEDPKTPIHSNIAKNQSKTPSSTQKLINGGSALLGSIKKSLQTFKFGISLSSTSNNENLPTASVTASTNNIPPSSSVSTSNLLLTSSFNRRKSYDLGLRMQLEQMNKEKGICNPHIGKIKPIDFSSKSIFLTSSTTSNQDEPNKINTFKQTSTSSFRKSILGSIDSNSYHPDLKTQVKSQNLKKINFESTQQVKKIRNDKIKMQKDADLNKKRNIQAENVPNLAAKS